MFSELMALLNVSIMMNGKHEEKYNGVFYPHTHTHAFISAHQHTKESATPYK